MFRVKGHVFKFHFLAVFLEFTLSPTMVSISLYQHYHIVFFSPNEPISYTSIECRFRNFNPFFNRTSIGGATICVMCSISTTSKQHWTLYQHPFKLISKLSRLYLKFFNTIAMDYIGCFGSKDMFLSFTFWQCSSNSL